MPTSPVQTSAHHPQRRGSLLLALVLCFACLLAAAGKPAYAQDRLLFCNNPEKIQMPGVYAESTLEPGKTYTVFFHYRNATKGNGHLVVALNGIDGGPIRFTARKGFADPRRDPPTAGKQAMARFLSSPEVPFTGKKGYARFDQHLASRQVASGVMNIRCDQPTKLRIYWRHSKWSVPGAHVVTVDSPRREVAIDLTGEAVQQFFRIGQPEDGMSRHLDGTYGMLYAFKVAAPPGRKVRVSFSPRGGTGGLVGSVNGALRQSRIVPAASWKVFCEAVAGENGLRITTAPFGGVFYPVEIVFQLI
jgi:hypothetical protein